MFDVMKAKFLFFIALISIITIFIFQFGMSSKLSFSTEESAEIDKIVLRALNPSDKISDQTLSDSSKTKEIWGYFNSIKLKEVKSFETYTKPSNEWELIFYYYDGSGDSLEILYEGSLIRKDGKIYIPVESKVDIENIIKYFLN